MIDGSTEDAWRMPKLVAKTRYLTPEEFRAVYDRLEPCRRIESVRGGQPFVLSFAPGSVVAKQRQDAQDLLVALTLSGGRWSEVASLRWDRIDLDRKVIRLWGSKGQKERLIGTPDLLHSMLSRRLAARKAGPDLLFPSLSGTQLEGSSQAILKAMEACG